jgi:hypothetical protein
MTGQVVTDGPIRVEIDYELEELPVDRLIERRNLSPCTEYTELGSTIELWDWRAESFDLVYFQGNSPVPSFRNVLSPFHTPGTNINHLAFLTNGAPRDYEPADGWELLYRNLGTATRPVEESSYGLYNRLDGRIRIFFYIEPNDGTGPSNVFIRLRQLAVGDEPKVTGLFENLNIPANSLANFDKDVSVDGMVQLNDGVAGSQWYILEGVASYDPCLCQHESALAVEPLLTEVTSLTFNMNGTGTSDAVYSAGEPISSLGFFNQLNGKFLSGYKRYEDIQKYRKDAKESESQTIKVLSSVSGIFAGVGGVTDLLGFVLGKKSNSGTPKLTGYNHNFSFEADGNLTTPTDYDPYFLYSPGSFYKEEQLRAHRPVYDNPLGVLAVLESPVVERQETVFRRDWGNNEQVDITTIRWRFAGGLRYHINTLAGISDRPVQLLASLVWPDRCNNKADFFATPAINITCLEDFVVEFEESEETLIDPRTGDLIEMYEYIGCYGEPELQIVAVLTSTHPTAGQEILYSARYATRIQRVPDGTIGENPFKGMTIEEVSNSCTNTTIPRPLSDFGLSRFCERRYDPDFGKSGLGEDIMVEQSTSIKEPAPSDFAAFPNPFTSQLSVEIPLEWTNTPLQFQLLDVLGRTVWEQSNTIGTAGQYLLANDLGHLPTGTYLVTVSSKTFLKTLTIQKQ